MQKSAKPKKKILKVDFKMIEKDKQFYLENCNFNEIEEKVFNYLTGKKNYSIVQIADIIQYSDRTTCRIIKSIKLKMLKAILFK